MKSWRFIVVSSIFFALFGVQANADDLVGKIDGQAEVRVVADRMEAETLNDKVIFIGNVRASQNDVVIYAQKMTLYYLRGEEGKENGIERAEIEGDIRIIQTDRMATAEKGLFLNSERQIILSGNAEVHQAENVVKGDEIIYFLDEERSVVKGTSETRVNAVIKPKGEVR